MKSKISLLAALCLSIFISINSLAQVGVNPTGAAPDNSAMLDVNSSNKGFLLPRVALVSTNNPIASPAEGLLVFNDGGSIGPNGFYYFDGTAWNPLTPGSISDGHYVGEVFGGGIVFFVDSTGQHGLMASLDDLDDLDGDSLVEWSNVHNIGTGAYSMTDGVANTDAILATTTTSAALLCRNHNGGGHIDWYLPSNRELILLFSYDIIIDHVLDNDGDPNTRGFLQETTSPGYTNSAYWSSTDDGVAEAWAFICPINYSIIYSKANPARVRAIRAF